MRAAERSPRPCVEQHGKIAAADGPVAIEIERRAVASPGAQEQGEIRGVDIAVTVEIGGSEEPGKLAIVRCSRPRPSYW